MTCQDNRRYLLAVNIAEKVSDLRFRHDIDMLLHSGLNRHSGSLFTVTLFESEQEKFRLTPTSINRTKIMPNDELADQITQLWD